MTIADDEDEGHLEGEATPQEVTAEGIPEPQFGLHDGGWTDEQWRELLITLVNTGMGSWKDVAALVLGHLNPSQVGTSLASSEGFKRKYGKGNTMRVVKDWVYHQTGRCADCGTRLELQADHIKGREKYEDPLDADFIENMTLRCRRCNVIRRPSHEFGGLTFLTAESALMWILLVVRPRTYHDYVRMCRIYGMTMSDIRMTEAWAMAHWLARAEPPSFGIEDDDNGVYDILLWPDGAVTRQDVGSALPDGASHLYTAVPGVARLGFLSRDERGRIKIHEEGLSFIPFSTYELPGLPAQALCIRYSAPDRINGQPRILSPLPPRGTTMLSHAIAMPNQAFVISSRKGGPSDELANAPPHGRLVRTQMSADDCFLQTT